MKTGRLRIGTVVAASALALAARDEGSVLVRYDAARLVGGQPPVAASHAAGPDLVVRRVDRTGVTGDWQALTIGGTVEAEVANDGDAPTGAEFTVTLFEDADGNARFERAIDRVLGALRVNALDAGGAMRATVPVAGTVAFRHNLVYAIADSGREIAEAEEGNNTGHSGQMCEFRPPPGGFSPALEWEWAGSTVDPTSDQVMMMPAVVDLTGDHVPEIVFSSYDGVTLDENGRLRAIHGDGSGEVFTVTDRRYAVRATAAIAVGDIDVDGWPEIVAVAESGDALLAFEHDGAFKWRSVRIAIGVNRGGAAIADLDGDGTPEIVIGATVLDNRGRRIWSGAGSRGENRLGYGPLSLVADLDLVGDAEVLAGNTAYRSDGTVLWQNRLLSDGFNAIGDFDGDPFPEIVLVSQQRVYVLEHDGMVKWGPRLLPGRADKNAGGPPTVADVDGDGEAEIGVAGGYFYTVFETDGTIKWRAATQDLSSHVTGSSVFDFEGDGSAEVIYSDEQMLRIYRGVDGEVLWEVPSPSGTTYDMPVIADVDADGNAEIVMVSNRWRRTGIVEPHGVQVYGDANDTWVRTRPLWNQHTYHIDNINDDGSIPAVETPSWQAHNTYRLNLPARSVFLAPDLTASRLVIDDRGYPASVLLTGRIGNGGADVVAPGLPVAFYDGDPAAGGALIGVVETSVRLPPGMFEDVSVTWPVPRPGTHTIYVAADDDGTGRGAASECDETNNLHWRQYVVAPTPTPTATATSTPTPTATWTASPTTTATSTPRPPPKLFLPLALQERWVPKPRHLDVVLVIDASTSMLKSAHGSQTKLVAAVEAVGLFLDRLRLGTGDRAAIVVFNRDVKLAQPLTDDRAALDRALGGLGAEVRQQTRIHLGIETAHLELARKRRTGGNSVMIVLTDGWANPEPASLAVERAAAAKADDILVLTIGLGRELDVEALKAIATRPDYFHWAPGASDLGRIYESIAELLPCPAERFWGRRC